MTRAPCDRTLYLAPPACAQRGTPLRPLALLLTALALASPALAQNAAPSDNATGNETADADPTPGAPVSTPPAQAAGPLEIVLEAHTLGGAGYFTLEGAAEKNPVLRVAPGQEVRVTLKGTDEGVHNFCIGTGKCTAFVMSAGAAETYTFTAPEDGALEYYCQPHRTGGMKGTLAVGDAAAATDAGGVAEGAISGETVDLSQYDPSCAGRVAPAIVTKGIVGAPTLDDYVAACKSVTTTQAKQMHAADYVIPLSWALIGLGVAGVVWVHKYYKP